MAQNEHARSGNPIRRSRIAFWVFAAIAAYFLIVEHREHVIGFLPYALILACPLMHVFHRRHGGHGGHGRDEKAASRGTSSGATGAGSTHDEHCQ